VFGDCTVIEGGLVHVDTELLNAEDQFCLCTACGDVFIVHVSLFVFSKFYDLFIILDWSFACELLGARRSR